MDDDADFDAFVREAAPRLLARAVLYCGNRQNAEDAVQDALCEAYLHWSEIRFPSAWMETTVIRRLAKDGRRWWFRWNRTATEPPMPARSDVEEQSDARAVLTAVGQLPPRQRQVLIKVCLHGSSYREVADELGISVGAVGANLAKARERMASLLGLLPTARRGGDQLLATSPTAVTSPAAVQDLLGLLLRRTESWLAREYAGDPVIDRIRSVARSPAGVRGRR